MEKGGWRGSGISVQIAGHDDDDDDVTYLKLWIKY